MKKIIPALAMLLISAIVMSTASYAWFASNTSVEAKGMSVKAQASGSLVIALENGNASKFDGKSTVEFTADTVSLNAVTYDSAWKYADPSIIDEITGQIKQVEDPDNPGSMIAAGSLTEVTQANVNKNTASTYYKDYLVYIAASGDAITIDSLNAVVTFDKVNDGLAETRKAMKVAFFALPLETVGAATTDTPTTWSNQEAPDATATYLGGAVVTGQDTKWAAASVAISGVTSIPSASVDQKVLPIVMRVYFDGAAAGSDGTCYVNSTAIDTTAMNIDVKFSIVKATDTP